MIDTVVFDLGKVLLDWSPGYFYRSHFGDDEAALERFLAEVVTPDWIAEMDAGKPVAVAIAEGCARHPNHAELIARWRDGYDVVYGARASRRGDGWFKRGTARGFSVVMNRLSDIPIPGDAGDFRLMSRPVVEVLRHMPCLLYTSDAADERSSVDLGGRRIIKKKRTTIHGDLQHRQKNEQRNTQTSRRNATILAH